MAIPWETRGKKRQNPLSPNASSRKKVLSLVLCVAVMLSVMVLGTGAAFSDQADIENTEAVEMATALNIIDGYEDGSYHPERNIKRSEMCKMICIALNGGKEPATSTKDEPTFSDIDGHWAEGYIEYCYAQGVVSGVGGGRFNPDGNVTVTQAAKMLLVALGYNAEVEQFTGDNWSLYVNVKANQDGIYEDLETIDTAAALTRDQAAQMIWNTMQAVVIVKTSSIDVATGEVTSHYNKHERGNTLLMEKYSGDIGVGFMTGYTYDATKGLWSYTFDGADYNGATISDTDKLTDQITLRTAADYTALFGQQVKVVYKTTNTDVVYGVYANDSSIVTEGYSGDVTASSLSAANATEIKINDVTYKLDNAANATNVIYYQNGSVVDTLNDMAASIPGHYTYQMVDNNGNGKIDLVIITPFTFGKVTYVGNDAITITLQNGDTDAGVSGNLKLDDVITYDGIAKDDYVMCVNAAYAVKEDPTYTKLTPATGTVNGLRDTDGDNVNDEFKIGDTWYTANHSGTTLNSGDNVEYIGLGKEIYYAKVVEGTIGADAVAVVYDIATKTASGISSGYVEAGLMIADGSEIVGEVVEVNDTEVTASDVGTTTYTGTDASGNAKGAPAAFKLEDLAGELVKYEVDGDGDIHLWTIPAGYDAAAADTQIMGFDGTLAANAQFVNDGDKVGTKELADDAVVFVWNSAKDEADVYTGKEIKNTQYATFGGGTTFSTGLYGEINGFSYAQVVVLQSATYPTISTGANYGYLVKNAWANKEDGVWYRYYSYWNGSEVVEAKEKDQSSVSDYKAGSVITFDNDGEGIIKNVSLPLVREGYVTGVNNDGRVEINGCTENTKYDSDTVILYVDSKDTEGVPGGEITKGVDLDGVGGIDNNVLYITGGNDTFALIVVDVNHKIDNINAKQQNKVYSTAPTLSDAAAVTAFLNELDQYNVTVNGALDLSNASGAVVIDSDYDLVVTGALTVPATGVTINSDVVANSITNGPVTLADGASLTLNDDTTLANNSSIAGTLNVASGKKVSAASSATITLDGATINGAVDLSTGTSASLKGSINLNTGADLTFSTYTADASTTLNVKSGATMTDKSGTPCDANLTEVIQAGATVALGDGKYIVPGDATDGVLALSSGKVTITQYNVKVEGTAKLLNNLTITVAGDVYELVSGSLDMNGKSIIARNTDNKVIFTAGVAITGYTNQNFYASNGDVITNADSLVGKTFGWNTSGLGSGSSDPGWKETP